MKELSLSVNIGGMCGDNSGQAALPSAPEQQGSSSVQSPGENSNVYKRKFTKHNPTWSHSIMGLLLTGHLAFPPRPCSFISGQLEVEGHFLAKVILGLTAGLCEICVFNLAYEKIHILWRLVKLNRRPSEHFLTCASKEVVTIKCWQEN